jgi:hypothetical protein
MPAGGVAPMVGAADTSRGPPGGAAPGQRALRAAALLCLLAVGATTIALSARHGSTLARAAAAERAMLLAPPRSQLEQLHASGTGAGGPTATPNSSRAAGSGAVPALSPLAALPAAVRAAPGVPATGAPAAAASASHYGGRGGSNPAVLKLYLAAAEAGSDLPQALAGRPAAAAAAGADARYYQILAAAPQAQRLGPFQGTPPPVGPLAAGARAGVAAAAAAGGGEKTPAANSWLGSSGNGDGGRGASEDGGRNESNDGGGEGAAGGASSQEAASSPGAATVLEAGGSGQEAGRGSGTALGGSGQTAPAQARPAQQFAAAAAAAGAGAPVVGQQIGTPAASGRGSQQGEQQPQLERGAPRRLEHPLWWHGPVWSGSGYGSGDCAGAGRSRFCRGRGGGLQGAGCGPGQLHMHPAGVPAPGGTKKPLRTATAVAWPARRRRAPRQLVWKSGLPHFSLLPSPFLCSPRGDKLRAVPAAQRPGCAG